MFLYISFLRPPPNVVSPNFGVISMTPQIANDLRTELFDGTQDIFYSWSSMNASEGRPFPPISKPQKLTTWRSGNAYKELSVPLPHPISGGQTFRLVLTTHDQGHPHVINLASEACGERPFPVLSVPIDFSSRTYATIGKQEQVERIYRLLTPGGGQVFLMVKEHTSFDLDKKVWDSGIGLSSWLVTLVSQAALADIPGDVKELRHTLMSSERLDIIELGSGTGIVSLTLGALRSALVASESRGCIITTDLDSAMPLLQMNIACNETYYPSGSCRPQAVVLDWEDPQFPPQVLSVEGGFDVVVMADVTYNTSSFPALVRTLKSLVDLRNNSVKASPGWFILGYKERHPDERMLWDMALGVGVAFRRFGQRGGIGGSPVEIWIAKV